MIRRVVNLVTAVSLVLCVAVVALWVRSYQRSGHLRHLAPAESLEVTSTFGSLTLKRQRVGSGVGPWWEPLFSDDHSEIEGDAPFRWVVRGGGFGYGTNKHPAKPYQLDVAVMPWWSAAAVLGVPPLRVLLGRLRRSRRARLHLCRACGYDLTGNVSGVYPECGMETRAPG